jgi:hypothetical protein
MEDPRQHRHLPVARRALSQRLGVPHEVERIVCPICGRVLSERPVRTARSLAA